MGGLIMHPTSNAFRYFKGLVLVATLLALCVVSLGAYVRLTDAGLGCPDWPGCYGTLTVPQSEAAILQAQTTYPDSAVEVGKAWREMAHRYLAGTLGLLVLAIFVLGWKARKEIKSSPYTSSFLLLLIGFQAMLGMWTVTMLLKPAIVSGHLLGGMSTLAVLTWLAHRHWGYYSDGIVTCQRLRLAIRLALVLLFMQIFLGGWTSTNYAALACTDFPTCHGAWVPDMDFKDAFHMVRELGLSKDGSALSLASLTAIQWTHRVGALVSLFTWAHWA
jgi:cytochrome c oxidase assembly protein subunit 15